MNRFRRCVRAAGRAGSPALPVAGITDAAGISVAVLLGPGLFAVAAPSAGTPATPRSPSSGAQAPKIPDDAALSVLPPSFIPPPLVPPRSDTGVAHVAPSESLEALAVMLAKTPDVVVAEVAGTPITLGMVAEGVRSLPPMWGATPSRDVYDYAVTGLIQMRMLALKAKQAGMDKDPAVKRRIAMAIDRELGGALIKDVTRDAATDAAVRAAYEKDYAGKPGPEEVWLRVIGAASKPAAEEALSKIALGMPFAQAVQDFSKDPSHDAGGDVGYVTADALPPELASVTFSLPIGGVSAYPLQSNGLWYIVEVEGRRTRSAPPLAEVSNLLANRLKFEAARSFIVKTRDETDMKQFGVTGVGGDKGQAVGGK